MNRRSRVLLALVLVLSMPLRAMAALAMPCCASDVVAADHATMTMSMSDMPMDAHDDDHAHASLDCCAFVMIAVPSIAFDASPYAPPFARPLRAPASVAFVTDAPERPPRA
jgi:hypothetical protein